jgi:hypothetical protein
VSASNDDQLRPSSRVIGVVCLIFGINTGFSGADGALFSIVRVALIAVGVLAFVY